jgi:hypothetical protein
MKFQGYTNMKATISTVLLSIVLAACSAGGSTGGVKTNPIDPTNPVAADLIVTVSTPSPDGLKDTGAETATVTVTAVDANRNIVVGAPVTIVPDNTAVVTASAAVTDTTGVVTGKIGIGSNQSNRIVAVAVTSGSISKAVNFVVTGGALTATLTPANVLPSTAAAVSYLVADANGTPIAGVPIAVTGLPDSAGPDKTDANGRATFNYTSPATEQVLTVAATSAGVTTQSSVTVSSGVVAPVAAPVQSASLTADPSTVSINAPDTTNPNVVNLRALFLGSNNQPIPNIRVRFDLDGDASGTGGTLDSAGSVVYSDTSGVARTTYTPGSIQSGNQKMVLRACWSNNDFAPVTPDGAACPNGQQLVSPITVAGASVSIAYDADNLIAVLPTSPVIYQRGYAVQVIDSVGHPVAGALVSGSVDLPVYYKGQFTVQGAVWAPAAPGPQSCNNEDLNRSGNKDDYGNGNLEDANASGALEPYAAAVTITAQTPTSGSTHGSDYTDKFGRAYFYLQYGANYATWEDFVLTFSAVVAGSEGHRSTLAQKLPGLTTDFTNTAQQPPFKDSPYGTDAASPYKLVTPLTGTPTSLCTESPDNVIAH